MSRCRWPESAFRLHVVPYLGHLSLADIKEGRIRSWRKALVDNTVGQATRAKAYRVIKRNPCRIPNGGKEESAERAALSIDEVFAVADAIKPRYRVLVLFGATTKELRARMGHSSVRAAIIYQHASREG